MLSGYQALAFALPDPPDSPKKPTPRCMADQEAVLRRTGIFKLFRPSLADTHRAMTMAKKFVINIADEAFNAYLNEGEFIDAVNEFAADLINAVAVGQVAPCDAAERECDEGKGHRAGDSRGGPARVLRDRPQEHR